MNPQLYRSDPGDTEAKVTPVTKSTLKPLEQKLYKGQLGVLTSRTSARSLKLIRIEMHCFFCEAFSIAYPDECLIRQHFS